jgi:Family of unknown function (DUF6011)
MNRTFLEMVEDLDSDLESEAPASGASHSHDDMRGRLQSAPDALRFMQAGKSTVTLVSVKTGNRFTYRISVSEDGLCHFVGLLSGPDNGADYKYLGRIARGVFWLGRKVPRAGDISRDAPSARAFDWTWRQLAKGAMPESLEIWHEGACGRCGRRLTVPESIASGFGPECRNKIGQL